MKRNAFEEILEQEFRWPTAGDKAFVAMDDQLENADLSGDGHQRMVVMMDGYRLAADLLVDRAMASRADRDFLVNPIIFNYRQFLELSLKYLIATLGPHVGIQPNWRSHDLAMLWREVALMLERFGTEDPDDADPVVAEIVAEFAKIDPGSYSHRYPYDVRGEPIPLAIDELHLPTLRDVMLAVAGYVNGCDGFLTDRIAAGTEDQQLHF